jgi:AcrR family transcriptional regulator
MAERLSNSPAAPVVPLRERNQEATRARLLEAAVAAIERGVEPTMRGVADEAGVGERTVYRYFESRDALVEALSPVLGGRLGVPLCDDVAGLERYASDLFGVFERNRALVVGTLHSAWMAPQFKRSRRGNLDAMRALVDKAYPAAAADDRAAAASALRSALSGSSWVYLRESCGMKPAEVVAHAQWLVRTLRAKLAARPRR